MEGLWVAGDSCCLVWRGDCCVVGIFGVDSNALQRDQGSRCRAREWHLLESDRLAISLSCSHISSIVCIHNDDERACLRWRQLAHCLIVILYTAFLTKRCFATPPIHFHRQFCVKRSSAT